MIDNEIRSILQKREQIHSEDYIRIEKCWEKEIEILCRDMSQTMEFIYNRCTGEEFVWLSEVFDEVAKESQSKEFISCLYETAGKYLEITKEYNLVEFIDSAKEFIE